MKRLPEILRHHASGKGKHVRGNDACPYIAVGSGDVSGDGGVGLVGDVGGDAEVSFSFAGEP